MPDVIKFTIVFGKFKNKLLKGDRIAFKSFLLGTFVRSQINSNSNEKTPGTNPIRRNS